jgi:hypothetical protein
LAADTRASSSGEEAIYTISSVLITWPNYFRFTLRNKVPSKVPSSSEEALSGMTVWQTARRVRNSRISELDVWERKLLSNLGSSNRK